MQNRSLAVVASAEPRRASEFQTAWSNSAEQGASSKPSDPSILGAADPPESFAEQMASVGGTPKLYSVGHLRIPPCEGPSGVLTDFREELVLRI